MNVNFYLSNTNFTAKRSALSNIDNINSKVIILTPDRNTMNIEKEILEILDKESVFNVNVTTFARICKNYLVEKKLYKNVLTKHASIALIKKILLESKDNLKIFKNNIDKDGFAEKIFETICLYRSCGITPENFHIERNGTLLEYKLEDILLVYKKYEECFQEEYTDSFNQLDLFEKNLDKEYFQDTDIYLVDFEDITPTILRVVAKIAKNSKSLNICTTYSKALKDINNHAIYTNDIYYNLKNVFELEGIKSNNIYVEDENINRSKLSKILFSGKGQNLANFDLPSLELIKSNNIENELCYVLASIKKSVLDKECKLSEIGLIVADLETYKKELIIALDKVGLPYYIDESESLKDNILGRITLQIFECMCKGLNKYNILKIIDTGIFKLTLQEINEYKAYVNRIDAKGSYLYSLPDKIEGTDSLKHVLGAIANFVEKIKVLDGSVYDYQNVLNEVLESLNYNEYYQMLYSKYVDSKDIINAKKLTQSYNKLSKTWQELAMVFGNEKICKSDFYSIYKTFVEDIKLSLAPIKVDSLIISDFNNSFISEYRKMYMIGANDNSLPKYSIETALLSDKEIGKLKEKNRLTPTINLLNKRKKFKLYETVLKAKEDITFSYVSVDSKGEELYPTIVYSELEKYLNKRNIIDANENLLIDNSQSGINKIILKNISYKLATE